MRRTLLWGMLATAVLPADGSILTWGADYYGVSNPPPLLDVIQVEAGSLNNLALLRDGTPVSWGFSDYANIPDDATNLVYLSGGGSNSIGLSTDGRVVTWGSDSFHKPGDTDPAVDVAAGTKSLLVVRQDGTVTGWGLADAGGSAPLATLSNVTAVASGRAHSLALMSDGRVTAWGTNDHGQINVPPGLIDVVAVAAGSDHSLALRGDGTVVGWGRDTFGAGTDPASLADVIAIDCGHDYNLALRADGSLAAWGGGAIDVLEIPAGAIHVVAMGAGREHGIALQGAGAPVVLIHPSPRSIHTGQPASFRVQASGGWPLHHQWFRDGAPITGATNALFRLPAVSLESSGTYSVSISNAFGETTGRQVDLSVTESEPIILEQPVSQIVYRGASTGLRIVANGSYPLHHQWMHNGVAISGATNSSLAFEQVSPAEEGDYFAVVSNEHGSVVSDVAVLRINPLVTWGSDFALQPGLPLPATTIVDIAVKEYHNLALQSDGTLLSWGNGAAPLPDGIPAAIAIGGGTQHHLIVLNDGGVLGWGSDDFGQATPPANLTDVVAVDGGRSHSIALKSDGTLAAWGADASGKGSVPPGLSNVVAIAAGNGFNLALKDNGRVVAWGEDFHGETNPPADLEDVIAVSAGDYHALALVRDGTVRGWGSELHGASEVPSGLTNAVAIACGSHHNAVLLADGTLVQWGFNDEDQTSVPEGLDKVVAVAAGARHTVAVTGDGSPVLTIQPVPQTVYSGRTARFTAKVVGEGPSEFQWYHNEDALPGATEETLVLQNVQPADGGHYRVVVTTAQGAIQSRAALLQVLQGQPVLVTEPADMLGSAGTPTTLSVVTDGSLPQNYQWYRNGLPIPGATNATLLLHPLMPGDAGDYTVTAGNAFGSVTSIAATLEVSPVVAWGLNGLANHTVPSGLESVRDIAASGVQRLALRADGRVVQWGHDLTNVVDGISNAVAISAGNTHFVALLDDGTVAAWGNPANGRTTVPLGLTNVVAIDAGAGHTLALTGDGTVAAWGHGADGQTLTPADLTNVVAVSAGGALSMALLENGRVVCWGSDLQNQHAPPEEDDIVAIAAGSGHSLLLKVDGTVRAFGPVDSPAALVPEGLSNVVAISSSGGHNLALREDGTVAAWGLNEQGQTNVINGLTNVFRISAGFGLSLALAGDGSPRLTGQPWSRVVHTGRDVNLKLNVSGNPPLRHQWWKDGEPMEGATNALLTLSNISHSDGGTYSASAQNASGLVESSAFTLHPMDAAPILVANPSATNVLLGGRARFQVVVEGSGPISYQWQHNGLPIPGATNSALWIDPAGASDIGTYTTLISNPLGTVETSGVNLALSQVAAWGTPLSNQNETLLNKTNVSALAAGAQHSLLLLEDGALLAWGSNRRGETSVPDLRGRIAGIAAGRDFSAALMDDGRVAVWGGNNLGETNAPVGLTNAISIAAGQHHLLALTDSGQIVAWGHDNAGQASVPDLPGPAIAVSAGNWHSLALLADGGVIAWGNSDFGQTEVPAELTDAVAIAAGGFHNLALRRDGSVIAWGGNDAGQSAVPADLTQVVAIAAGFTHSVALTASFEIVAWGRHGFAQAAPSDRIPPARALAGGENQTLALLAGVLPAIEPLPEGNQVFSGRSIDLRLDTPPGVAPPAVQWSHNGIPIPHATNLSLFVPNTTLADSGDYQVAAEYLGFITQFTNKAITVIDSPPFDAHPVETVELKLGGRTTLHAGVGGSLPMTFQWLRDDVPVIGETNASLDLSQIHASDAGNYSVAVSNAFGGSIIPVARIRLKPVAWGMAGDLPVEIPDHVTNAVAIAAGASHSLVLQAGGNIVAWGDNSMGQTQPPFAMGPAKAVAAGAFHSLAVSIDGRVVGWGARPAGSPPPFLRNVTSASAGRNHSLVLRRDGTVAAWGAMDQGQGLVPAGLGHVLAIAAGGDHNLVLHPGGKVSAWGRNDFGQTTVPPGLTDVVQIAAGGDHSMALRSDGGVVVWGRGDAGQWPPPADLPSIAGISAGDHFCLAVTKDGSLIGWGDNSGFQLDWPAGVARVIALTAGSSHALAISEPIAHSAPPEWILPGPTLGQSLETAIHGWPGIACLIEASADLHNWSPILLDTLGTSGVRTYSTDTVGEFQFLRIRVPTAE